MVHLRRDRRRDQQKEAVERQQEHDTLSVSEKIAKAEYRPGKSEKEIKRLRAQDQT